jgi:ribosome biogenesis GTPase
MQSIERLQIKTTGTVYKKAIGHYFVWPAGASGTGASVTCSISTKLRRQLLYPIADPNSIRPHVVGVRDIDVLDPVAVGDAVAYIDAQDGSGLIVEVLPRRNKLIRRSAVPMPGAHPFEQVIVANVDQVIAVMAAAKPLPKWNLLDRYLASAESQGLPALICLTKTDLVEGDSELLAELETYRRIGYPVFQTSALSGAGLAELREAIQGRISVLVGKSGVGKSTLLNSLQPGLGLRVKAVNATTGKGKHTTANLELVPLAEGGGVVDTPGMREFGLYAVAADELALLFPELRPLVGRCKFGLDCGHRTEPGCAIRQAAAAGKVSQRRYASYLKLCEE